MCYRQSVVNSLIIPKHTQMQTNTLSLFLGVTIACAGLSACNDKEKTADDKTPPTIDVITPVAGQTYALNDTIYFEADIEDESELSDLQVNLIVGTDTTLIWPTAPTGFGNISSYTINNWHVNTVAAVTDATVSFYAIDKHDNEAVKDVQVQLTN